MQFSDASVPPSTPEPTAGEHRRLVPQSAAVDGHRWRRSQALYHGLLLGMSSVIVALSFLFSVPSRGHVELPGTRVRLPGICMSRTLLGLDCPGCGLTRCFVSLAHGQFARAWQFNPAGFILFPLVMLQIPYRAVQLFRLLRGWNVIRLEALSKCLLWLVLAALLVQWLVHIVVGWIG